eukprot:UN25710
MEKLVRKCPKIKLITASTEKFALEMSTCYVELSGLNSDDIVQLFTRNCERKYWDDSIAFLPGNSEEEMLKNHTLINAIEYDGNSPGKLLKLAYRVNELQKSLNKVIIKKELKNMLKAPVWDYCTFYLNHRKELLWKKAELYYNNKKSQKDGDNVTIINGLCKEVCVFVNNYFDIDFDKIDFILKE